MPSKAAEDGALLREDVVVFYNNEEAASN